MSSKSRPLGVLWTLHLGMDRFFNKFYKAETSWPLRILVKLGIAVSFMVRAAMAGFGRFGSGSSSDSL